MIIKYRIQSFIITNMIKSLDIALKTSERITSLLKSNKLALYTIVSIIILVRNILARGHK
jgi:hypothetical protein